MAEETHPAEEPEGSGEHCGKNRGYDRLLHDRPSLDMGAYW